MLLEILAGRPELGRPIFESLFRQNRVDGILSFLDERSGLLEEARIFSSLPGKLFLGTFLRQRIPGLAVPSEG